MCDAAWCAHVPERLCGGPGLQRGAITSVLPFLLHEFFCKHQTVIKTGKRLVPKRLSHNYGLTNLSLPAWDDAVWDCRYSPTLLLAQLQLLARLYDAIVTLAFWRPIGQSINQSIYIAQRHNVSNVL